MSKANMRDATLASSKPDRMAPFSRANVGNDGVSALALPAYQLLNFHFITSQPFWSDGSKIRSVQIRHTSERTRKDTGFRISFVDLFVKCPAIIFEESAMNSSFTAGTNPMEQVGEHSRSIATFEGSSSPGGLRSGGLSHNIDFQQRGRLEGWKDGRL